MQGSKAVIDCLVALLRGELSARDQYFVHSRRYQDMGLNRLYVRIDHEMQEEAQHADAILQRILFLGGDPDMRPLPFTPGRDLVQMLETDLQTEYDVRQRLQAAMALCEAERDFVTRDLLLMQLRDTEEDHTYWLEQQLRLIKLMGLPNYVQSSVGGAD
ncbi:bacterioferritin [Sinimarinibacterium sp. NLF-5-8]|uniref:bacterioferritin n=1 Tax=Sinimarinibacterium sp. NLF-5-8 TaxID=2698684 RepID=UPI00137BC955|nr:bacterioferritin [Sinimarinibacterium sp. NLF-5-8]QHS09369.1 bacterioferritin [Sinimarinibacterium sp. NLF-5-8]